jgi:hypothetical protein
MIIYIALLIVLIIVMIVLVLIMIVRSKKDRALKKQRAEELEIKKAVGQFQQNVFGMDQTDHQFAPAPAVNDIRCHKCGIAIPVTTMQRPLVIHCENCETRGVIYD